MIVLHIYGARAIFLKYLLSLRHWVGVTRNGNWFISISIHTEKYHRIYGTMKFIQFNMRYLYGLNIKYFWMGRNFLLLIVFRLSSFVFLILLFCDHQDTESESCEIEMIISQPISTHKNISNTLWDNNIYTLQYWRNILWLFFIFVVLEPFS